MGTPSVVTMGALPEVVSRYYAAAEGMLAMDTTLVGLAIAGGVGALAWAVAAALIEDGLRGLVRRRFPRFSAWWDSSRGLSFRCAVLAIVFGVPAVVLTLPAMGWAFSDQPEPVLWIMIVPMAGMALWSLWQLRRLRKASYHEGFGNRSSDGTWSAN